MDRRQELTRTEENGVTGEVRELRTAAELAALAAWLGDSPETVWPGHRLRSGLARAVVVGPLAAPRAALVQAHLNPRFPAGFGDDPAALWAGAQRLSGWEALNVSSRVAPALAAVITAATGRATLPIEEPFYTLNHPAPDLPHPAVRWLTPADEPLLLAATEPLDMAGWRLGSAAALLATGFVTGAVIDGRLVAVSYSSCFSERYVEIGVATEEAYRGQGLAPAAATLLAAGVQAGGRQVVWSTSEENTASQRVAAKLGFTEVSRRVYVNLV